MAGTCTYNAVGLQEAAWIVSLSPPLHKPAGNITASHIGLAGRNNCLRPLKFHNRNGLKHSLRTSLNRLAPLNHCAALFSKVPRRVVVRATVEGEDKHADSLLCAPRTAVSGTLLPAHAQKDPSQALAGTHQDEACAESANLVGKGGTQMLGRRQLVAAVPSAVALLSAGYAVTGGGTAARALTGGLNQRSVAEQERERAVGTALDSLRSRVSSFRLANGMRWVVLERHVAPIVACHTFADVGAADEEDGVTGVAHLLEHLAFKGTAQVGTTDAAREASILDSLDEVFYEVRDARESGNTRAVASLSERFAELQRAAAELAVPNQYGSLLARQGGVGLNAQTSQDSTEYFVSLPANKLELWMALESARFIAPVFRELYSEKEVRPGEP
eukprot:jgi/Mesen1/5969/ME000301S05092